MGALAWGMALRVEAAQEKILLLQDENFFLQDEIRKMQAELVDKDNALKKLLIEKEAARINLDAAARQKDFLESKVDALQKMILARDADFPEKVEQAALPYRFRMEEAVGELKAMTMALEQKNAHVAELVGEKDALVKKADLLTGEKISLLGSLRKISAERDELKSASEGMIADAHAQAEAKVKDFQLRLAAEQTLVQEKIAEAKKPLEDKLALMEARYQAKEDALRANAAAQMKDMKQQLDACRQASSLK